MTESKQPNNSKPLFDNGKVRIGSGISLGKVEIDLPPSTRELEEEFECKKCNRTSKIVNFQPCPFCDPVEKTLTTLEEAKKFLKIASGPKDWADENSNFHKDNLPSFKEICIAQWLAAQDLISRAAQKKADYEHNPYSELTKAMIALEKILSQAPLDNKPALDLGKMYVGQAIEASKDMRMSKLLKENDDLRKEIWELKQGNNQ